MQTDIRRDVIPRLQKLKGIVIDATMALKGDLIVAQDAEEECELQSVQVNESKLLLESKLRRIEESYKKERGALEQHATAHDREMDSLESKLIELRDISAEESRAVHAKRKCGELKASILGNRDKHDQKKAEINRAVMTAAIALADYKEQMQQRLAEVKAMTEERLESVLCMGADGSLPSLPPSAHATRTHALFTSSLRSVGEASSCSTTGIVSGRSGRRMEFPLEDGSPATKTGRQGTHVIHVQEPVSVQQSSRPYPPAPPSVGQEVRIYGLCALCELCCATCCICGGTNYDTNCMTILCRTMT